MNEEWRPEANVTPWGPFISKNYKNERIAHADIVVTSVVWVLTLINVFIAIHLAFKQSKSSRSPLRSVFVWMIWLEMVASFIMGLECFLFVFKVLRPSFYFYSTILLMWCIQVQLLLQIIINRIRVIVPDRRRSRMIMIGTAVIVTAINISVFNIWIPARLQIHPAYVLVNNIWDRIEKVIYLIIDAVLNWYFLKTVKANLINNGLQKYTRLFRFNQRIIVLSLLMDVMIIAAMSIPNSFIYIQFHPLAYLVKLNIEMTMANLIKRIAVSTSHKSGNRSRIAEEYNSCNLSTSGQHTSTTRTTYARRSSFIELSNFDSKSASEHKGIRTNNFIPAGDQIKVTKDISIESEPNPEYEDDSRSPSRGLNTNGLKTGNMVVVQSKSVDDLMEFGSTDSDYRQGKENSDDERSLVIPHKKENWHTLDNRG